jgi:hypothetical protein
MAAILFFRLCDKCHHVRAEATSFFGSSYHILQLLYHKRLFFVMTRFTGCLVDYIATSKSCNSFSSEVTAYSVRRSSISSTFHDFAEVRIFER